MLQMYQMQRLAKEQAAKRRHLETFQPYAKVGDVVIAAQATEKAPNTEAWPTNINLDRKYLESTMTQYCRIHYVRFHDVLDLMKLGGVACAEQVDYAHADPP